MSKYDLNKLYVDYIETDNEQSFNKIYKGLYSILKAKFASQSLLNNVGFIYDFEDIFQITMIKLFTNKDKYDVKRGNVTSFAYIIFKNTIIDKLRFLPEKIRIYRLF